MTFFTACPECGSGMGSFEPKSLRAPCTLCSEFWSILVDEYANTFDPAGNAD